MRRRHRLTRAFVMTGLVLAVPITSSARLDAVPRRVDAPTFSQGPCPSELTGHPRITCGTLLVHDRMHGRGWVDTRLAVAIVRASSPTPKPDPIVFIHGGPGGEIVREAADVFENSGLDTDRDVIVIDERGGGLSTPTLTCPEVEQLDWYGSLARREDDPTTLRAVRGAVAACERRLVHAGTDPTAVSTRIIARDIAALRVALGIKQWNVLGFSYGGKVALALLRDHPEGIRSVLLDSPASPDESPFDPARARTPLEALFKACAASPSCASRHADLRAQWISVVRRLDRAPQSVSVPASADNPATTVLLDGSRFIEAAINQLADLSTIPTTPDWITAPESVARAGTAAAAHAVQNGPLGVELSILCREDRPRRQPVRPSPVTGRFPETTLLWHLCDGWRASAAPSAERALPRAHVPMVILHGQFDPAVTDASVARLAQRLHIRLIRFPGRTHGIVRGEDRCSIAVATAFFDAPGTAPDTSCVTSTSLP